MAKGKPAEMDIVQIHFGQKKIYSFLAVVWGIIADIDIESEWLRFMGSPRFTIQAIIRILNPRRYRGTLSFLPIADASKYEKLFEGRKISTNGAVHNTPSVVYAEAAVQAGAGILGNGRSDLGQGDDGILNPGFDSNESSETGRQSSSSLETTSYLPALNEPVPSDWVSIKGDFVCMSAVSVSHLAANVIAWPHRDFSEGAICIQYTKYPTARKSLLGMIEAFKDGSHMKFDFVESAFVKAFRFEPSEDKGVITVDGEKIDFGPIQGEMLPWKANVLIPDDAIGS